MRSTLSASRLVRQLAQAFPVEADASGMDFAERLGLWLGAFDAIHLQSAHQAVRGLGAAPAAARLPRPPDLAADLERARGVLARAIALDPLADHDGDPAWAPFPQRHGELQRQMEQMIGALRGHVRQSLARLSPRLRQLAALDAAMEQVLGPREQALLPTAAALLRQRFEQLRREPTGDDGAWLATFRGEWQQALLAELELRLEPVAGLVDALTQESRNPS